MDLNNYVKFIESTTLLFVAESINPVYLFTFIRWAYYAHIC